METICVFGDSIVYGSWDPEKGGWVSRLRSFLESNSYEVIVYNLGVSGNTTSDLLERFDVEAKAREPSIIIFFIGVNDDAMYVGNERNNRINIKNFEQNILKLIEKARKFTSKIVFVGFMKVDERKTMPVEWDKNIYYTNKALMEYDKKLKEVLNRMNVLYLEIFNLLNKEDLEDGLHPNSKGHEKIFRKVKEFLFVNKVL